MSCVEPQTEAKVIHDRRNCIVCRSGRPNYVQFAAGQNYLKCSLVYFPEKFGPAMPVTNLVEQCDKVYGIVSCGLDATEVDEATAATCKLTVLADETELDANLVCWPEGTSEEEINWFIETSKCCLRFRNVFTCSEVPDEFKDRIQTKAVKGVTNPVAEGPDVVGGIGTVVTPTLEPRPAPQKSGTTRKGK